MASLGCFENTDFTQLGFIVNLESKGDDIKKNPAEHTVGSAELRHLIGRLSSEFNMCVHVWREQTVRKQDRSLRRYLVPCPANAILFQNAFQTKQFSCCIIKVDRKIKYTYSFHST